MPYRSRRTDNDRNPEYFEPAVEQSYSVLDIEDFILTNLHGRDREICAAFVLSGESIGRVAATHNLSTVQIRTILRKALEPLAKDFGIITERQ